MVTKTRSTRRVAGFTLVELMIVVAIIGVLASLATYGVSRYLKHSKTAEATRNLGAIENGSRAAFQLDTDTGVTGKGPYVHEFCATGPAVPTTVPLASKVSTTGQWTAAAWTCLKFSINEPQFYAYSYQSAGTSTAATYSATAKGDLDGNTTQSSFVLNGAGTATGDARRVSLSILNEDE
jgi:type IV pilus assembly protein PilA